MEQNNNNSNQKQKIFYIRHGESISNKRNEKARQDKSLLMDPHFIESVVFSKDNLDTDLTEQGISEAKIAQKTMESKNIKLVIVSPLRRTLQTCQIIFKDHPCKPKIIVDPIAREILFGNNEIGVNIKKNMEEFTYMDFSLMQQYENLQLWVFEELCKQNKLVKFLQQKIKTQCEKDGKDYNSEYSLDLLIQHIKNMYPLILEGNLEILQRVEIFKNQIRKYIHEYQIDINKGEQLAVVAHGGIFRYINGQVGPDFQIQEFKTLSNCECFEYEF